MSNEREAMERIQAYLNERVPVRGIDQELIHVMNDKELRVSDIAALLAARQSAGATGQEPVGEWVQNPHFNCPHLKWASGYVAKIGAKLYAAPIGDNGAGGYVQYSDELTPRTPGEKAAFLEGIEEGRMRAVRDAQPAESKRVELTDEEIGHLRLIVAFCETLSSIEIGSYAYDALCALRLFLARASAKGE